MDDFEEDQIILPQQGTQEKLRKAIHYAVGQIVDNECNTQATRVSRGAIALMAEITYRQAETFSGILCTVLNLRGSLSERVFRRARPFH